MAIHCLFSFSFGSFWVFIYFFYFWFEPKYIIKINNTNFWYIPRIFLISFKFTSYIFRFFSINKIYITYISIVYISKTSIFWIFFTIIIIIIDSMALFKSHFWYWKFCISMSLRYYYYFGIFNFNTCIYFSERNRIISKYYYSKITQKL